MDGWSVDVLLKLQRATPLRCGVQGDNAMQAGVEFASLFLRSATLLPEYGAHGLGQAQQTIVRNALANMRSVVASAMHAPLERMTPFLVELLRTLARGSAAHVAELEFKPEGHLVPRRFKLHRYGGYTAIKEYLDSLARAELAYDMYLAGVSIMRTIDTEPFWEAVDAELPLVTAVMNAWALALLFDGTRLRRGLEVATAVRRDFAGGNEGFGSKIAARLTAGETVVARERTGCAVQLLLANARVALREINATESKDEDMRAAVRILDELEIKIFNDLQSCFTEREQRCPAPMVSMRIILDHVAKAAEQALTSPGHRLLFCCAFSYPCLVPLNLQPLQGYDGGLLGVWDACDHLLRLHAQTRGEVMPTNALLCAVMGGAVGGLMDEDGGHGPFIVHPKSAPMAEVRRMQANWPPTRIPNSVEKTRVTPMGKRVSATDVVCDAIDRRIFKADQRTTAQTAARSEAALTMHCAVAALAQLPGVADSKPTEGVVALKRLYFAALHFEPGTQSGKKPSSDAHETSAFSDGVTAQVPGAIAPESIEMAWRDVSGGACIGFGQLRAFSCAAFAESLQHDWLPRMAVEQALQLYRQNERGRTQPVMRPTEAMQLLARRAQAHVAAVVTTIDNEVLSVDGPPNASRAVAALNALANSVYGSGGLSGVVWESCVAHFASPTTKRAKRVPLCESLT